MSDIQVDGKLIGNGRPVFVIAEIGVNHDGSVAKALELVKAAARCGADAVKLQLFRASVLMHPTAVFAGYQKDRANADGPMDMLRRYELSADEVRAIVRAVRELKMVPLATPFSPADVQTIEALHLPAVKIASPDLVNRPLLEVAARLDRPLIVSTGAATTEEVDESVSWLNEWRCRHALLHCVSSYPVAPEQANLCWIQELAMRYSVPVGYSDHTAEPISGALAVCAGASIIEKHLTYDRSAAGPDHAASSDPEQFARYVKLVREAEVLRGSYGKRVLDVERDVREVSRQSLVARRELNVGDVVREEDVTVQRPGTGLPASHISLVVGRRIVRSVKAGALLQWDSISHAA